MTQIVCNNSTAIPSAKTNWILINRLNRTVKNLSENGKRGFWGAIRSQESWAMLASIRQEIAPKIQALRARQEVLESIGTRINGGF